MGASLTMIDRHYGHIARDGCEYAIRLLDVLNAPESEPWTLVDAGWTPTRESAASVDNKTTRELGRIVLGPGVIPSSAETFARPRIARWPMRPRTAYARGSCA